MGRRRIVSLLPSVTEVLFALGAGDQVVGVTYECTLPPEAAELPQVTDTIIPTGASPAEIDRIITDAVATGRELYTLDRDLLRSLRPDVIVTQDLCRVCALPGGSVADALADLGLEAEVFSYDPTTLDQVVDQIAALAAAVEAPGGALVDRMRSRLAEQREVALTRPRQPPVLLLEWVDPPFTPGHWIPDQIEAAGGLALLAHPGARSRATDWAMVGGCGAEVLVVAPCGFDGVAAEAQLQTVVDRPELRDLPAIRQGRVHAMDGDAYVVRPGPRLLDGIDELVRLIHP